MADRDFEPLVRTGTKSGTLRASQMITHSMFGRRLNPDRPHKLGQTPSISWRRTSRAFSAAALAADAGKDPKAKPVKAPDTHVNVVLVADFDMLTDEFFHIREQGEMPDRGINFDFDNVTFVLNAIDALAGEDRFLELRKRRPKHRTLTKFDERLEEARKQEAEARDNLRKEKDDNIKKENAKFKEEDRQAPRAAQDGHEDRAGGRREPRGHRVAGGPEADRRLQERSRREVQREDRRHQQQAGRQDPDDAGLVHVLGRGYPADRAAGAGRFRLHRPPRARTREGRRSEVAPADDSPIATSRTTGIRFWRDIDMSESVKTAVFVCLACVVGLVAFLPAPFPPRSTEGEIRPSSCSPS